MHNTYMISTHDLKSKILNITCLKKANIINFSAGLQESLMMNIKGVQLVDEVEEVRLHSRNNQPEVDELYGLQFE